MSYEYFSFWCLGTKSPRTAILIPTIESRLFQTEADEGELISMGDWCFLGPLVNGSLERDPNARTGSSSLDHLY
jgi:hypothetical protein